MKTEDDSTASLSGSGSQLRRVLSLWDLIFYGIVLIQPIAAVPVFGLADKLSQGHVVSTILIAMVAMMLTAVSYGRMAAVYPRAGSAYTYVSQALHPVLGFLTGWAMMLDYFVIPVINIIYGSLTLTRIYPLVPYPVWVVALTALITCFNLLGVRATARANTGLLLAMCLVVAAFMILAIRFLFALHRPGALFSLDPFYTPGRTSLRAILTATSLSALTYIGFDGITTLSEEAKDAKKNVLRATVLVCLITGLFSGAQVYLAQRVWPDYLSFPDVETAFMDVSRRVGGPALFHAMALTLVLASIGSGLSGQAGAARLLYGMGRDKVLPQRFFGRLSAKHLVPTRNICLIGLVTLLGALLFNFERAAELLNFGAFLAFMGVNLATTRHFYFLGERNARRVLRDLLLPLLGFTFCLFIWWGLPGPAKLAGTLWFAAGVAYLALRTRGFRTDPGGIRFDPNERKPAERVIQD